MTSDKADEGKVTPVVVAYGQARHVIGVFGGPRRMAEHLRAAGCPRDPASIYKWLYPKKQGGTDGLVPTAAWPDLFQAAQHAGILFTTDDLALRKRASSEGAAEPAALEPAVVDPLT